MISNKDLIPIGFVRKTYGKRGEVMCTLQSDALDYAEPEYVILEIDSLYVPFFLTDCRLKGDESAVMSFEDIADESAAARLTGCKVYLEKRQMPQGYKQQLTAEVLRGFAVQNENGQKVGRIHAVDNSTANTLIELEDGRYLPLHEDIIREIDAEKKLIVMDIAEGLLEL